MTSSSPCSTLSPTATTIEATTAGARGADLVLHLHGLDGQHALAGLDGITLGDPERARRGPVIGALTVTGPWWRRAPSSCVARSRRRPAPRTRRYAMNVQPSSATSKRRTPAARSLADDAASSVTASAGARCRRPDAADQVIRAEVPGQVGVVADADAQARWHAILAFTASAPWPRVARPRATPWRPSDGASAGDRPARGRRRP